MPPQALVHQPAEARRIPVQQLGALGKGQALGAVAAVVGHMAGGLVAHQIHMDLLPLQIFQQIHDIAVVGDGAGGLFRQMRLRQRQRLRQGSGSGADPALREAGVDAAVVHLGDQRHRAGDLRGLALRAAHAAQTGGNEQAPRKIALPGDAQFEPPGVEQRVEGAVDDALGADIHPAAGGHLPVIGHAQRRRPVEVLLVVKGAHHQAVGQDDPGRSFVGAEQTQRMAGKDGQRLLPGQLLQIGHNEPVLHPVLADLAGLAVGHQLIGIEGHIKIQIVVDHHLNGPALDAVSFIFVDGAAPDPAPGPEAIAVDAAVLLQLPGKLLRHLGVELGRDVAQRVFDGQRLVLRRKPGLPAGRAADARFKGRMLRKAAVFQQDGACVDGVQLHDSASCSVAPADG